MHIFLVRHGDAVPEEDAGSDRDRWLSAKGREHVRVLGRLLRDQSIVPEAIVCSPLPRAVQTAELLAQALDYLGQIRSLRSLEPSAQPRVAAGEISALAHPVIIVSHEPAISSLGAFLLGRPAFPQFRTAQCCGIENGKPTFSARSDLGLVQTMFLD